MTKIACPRLVTYSFLMPAVIGTFIVVAVAITDGITPNNIYLVVFPWIFLTSVMCIVYRKAFVVLHIDKSGIYSKYVRLDWNQIASISFSRVQIGVIPVKLKTTIAILNGEEESIFKINKRKAIYFEVNQSDISKLSNAVNMSDKDSTFSKISTILRIHITR